MIVFEFVRRHHYRSTLLSEPRLLADFSSHSGGDSHSGCVIFDLKSLAIYLSKKYYEKVKSPMESNLIISNIHRFIILSPWKSASQTLIATLERYDESLYDRFFYFDHNLNRVVHQHLTLSDLQAMPEIKLDYRISTFVRNPYDRAYSGFLQIQRDFLHQPYKKCAQVWVEDLIKDQISENMSRIIRSGFDFDRWIEILPEYEVHDIGRNTNMPLHPAHYWTHHDGKPVDFIGKVEAFEKDFEKFCRFVGIEIPDIEVHNVSLTETERFTGVYKHTHRMNRRSIEKINDMFHRDFELFNYDML